MIGPWSCGRRNHLVLGVHGPTSSWSRSSDERTAATGGAAVVTGTLPPCPRAPVQSVVVTRTRSGRSSSAAPAAWSSRRAARAAPWRPAAGRTRLPRSHDRCNRNSRTIRGAP